MSPRHTGIRLMTYVTATVACCVFGLLWLLAHPLTTLAQSQPEALGSVSGTVRNARGEPLANITVWLEQYRDDPGHPKTSGVSDEEGSYQIQGVFPGIYRVRFSDPSGIHADRFYVDALMPDDATTITVSGNHVDTIDATLLAGNVGAISVTVISDLPTAGLDSREVIVYRQADNGRWQRYRTELHTPIADDPIPLVGLPYGQYRLCVRLNHSESGQHLLCHENVAPTTLDSFITEATDITVANEVPVSVTVDFRLSTQVQGIVLSPEGTPLPGITVRLLGHDPFFLISDTITDEQGRFLLRPTYFGANWLLANLPSDPTRPDGGAPYLTTFYPNTLDYTQAETLQIEPSTRMSVTLQLARGGQVTGKATFPSGDPLYRPVFSARQYRNDTWEVPCVSFFGTVCPQQSYDIATHTYTITHIIPGTYRIAAEYDFPLSGEFIQGFYGGTEIYNAKNVAVRAGETQTNIDIVVGERGFDGAILGTVTAGGIPQAGIVASLHGWFYTGSIDSALLTATTDEQGHYALRGLSVGFYRLMFQDPLGRFVTSFYDPGGQGPFYVSGLRPTENVDFALSAGGRIQGRIFTPTGEAPAGYRIYVFDYYGQGPAQLLTNYDVITDQSGAYAINGLPAGDYLVAVHEPELPPFQNYVDTYYPGTFQQANAQKITIVPGEAVVGINIPIGDAPGVRMPFVATGNNAPVAD